MSVARLVSNLAQRKIQLKATGDRLRYHPESAVTAELLSEIKARKSELLAILQRVPGGTIDFGSAAGIWQMALCLLEVDPDFPPELLDALRNSEVDWADEEAREERLAIALEGNGLDPETEFEVIDPPEPCPECGSLELWKSMAGDLYGLTPGRWRCRKCDPPKQARRLAKRAAQLRQRKERDAARQRSKGAR